MTVQLLLWLHRNHTEHSMTYGEILHCFYSLSLRHLEFNKNGHNHSTDLIIRCTLFVPRGANAVTKWQRGAGAVSDTRWRYIPVCKLTLKHNNNFVSAIDSEQLITPFKVHRCETNLISEGSNLFLPLKCFIKTNLIFRIMKYLFYHWCLYTLSCNFMS
jgi:hypothetical protein